VGVVTKNVSGRREREGNAKLPSMKWRNGGKEGEDDQRQGWTCPLRKAVYSHGR